MSKQQDFWNQEYSDPEHLALSDAPSENLEKFARWLVRNVPRTKYDGVPCALDLGCGNGRNLIYLAKEFACTGYGYDTSEVAIKLAKQKAATDNLPVTFEVRSIAEPFPLKDESVDIVIDLMTSHVLRKEERAKYIAEVARVMKPAGMFMLKTFFGEGDLHAKRMLRDNPSDEESAYIHPKLGVYEYVWTEEKIYEDFQPYFDIKKVEKSHRHIMHGKAFKRRHIVVYMEKKW